MVGWSHSPVTGGRDTVKTLLVITAALALVAIISVAALSEGTDADTTFTLDGISYKVTSDNEVTVTGTTLTGDVSIVSPVYYNDKQYAVTSIGTYAMGLRSSIRTVTLPGSLTSINNYAFYSCSGLTSISIPDSVQTLGTNVFSSCKSLSSVQIGSGVTKINTSDFIKCTSLVSITIPDTVNEIGDTAFKECTSLSSISFPESVNTLGKNAFYGCTSLTTVTIGKNISSIGDGPFSDCTSLQNIWVSAENQNYSDMGGVLMKTEGSVLVQYPAGKNADTYDVKDVVTIGAYAFSGTAALESVTFDTNLTSIGGYAFKGCTSLYSILIPNSVDTIGGRAFSDCSSLETFTMSTGVKTVSAFMLYNCTSLQYVILPEGVETISGSAFRGCTALPAILFPSTIKTIGSCAFYSCGSLSSITLSSDLTDIGSLAFYDCTSLKSIIIPQNVENIGSCAFQSCTSLRSVEMPVSLKTLGGNAFVDCALLESLNIPAGVTTIGADICCGCTSLKEVTVGAGNTHYHSVDGVLFSGDMTTLMVYPAAKVDPSYIVPECVTTIGQHAFAFSSNLKSVTFGRSVESIMYGAFMECHSLEKIDIPDTVTYMEESVFAYCESLTEVKMSDSLEGVENYVFEGCTSITDVTLPNYSWYIGVESFCDCISLISISMPACLQYIDDYAFYGCSSLVSADIPVECTYIGEGSFYGCSKLSDVRIPAKVESICSNAFTGCTSITSFTVDSGNSFYSSIIGVLYSKGGKTLEQYPLGNTATSYTVRSGTETIGSYSFEGSTNLQRIELPSTVSVIGEYAFRGCTSLSWIDVSASNTVFSSVSGVLFDKSVTSLLYYPNAMSAAKYTVPDSVTSIAAYAFSDCRSLKEIVVGTSNTSYSSFEGVLFDKDRKTLIQYPCGRGDSVYTMPAGVEIISSYAFSSCTSLVTLTLSSSLAYINEGAFKGCTSLTTVDVYDGLIQICAAAFSGCRSLSEIYIPSSVQYIGSQAFYGCSSLKIISITENDANIGEGAFALGDEDNPVVCIVRNCPASFLDDYGNSNTEFVYRGYYLVTYDINGGDIVLDPDVSASGDFVLKGYEGTKDDCRFAGWTDGTAAFEAGATVRISGDTVFTALWERTDVQTFETSSAEGKTLICEVIREPVDGFPGTVGIRNKEQSFAGAVTIPETVLNGEQSYEVVAIYDSAFRDCSQITEFIIPKTVTSIGVDAFTGCSSITAITVDTENPAYVSVDGVLFSKDMTVLIIYPAAKVSESYTVPNGVIAVGEGAFEGCGLRSVVLSDTVETICMYAFRDSLSLNSVAFNDGLVEIAESAFSGCVSLSSLDFGDSLSTIGFRAFNGCSSLTSLEIPAGVTGIDMYAFSGCSSLQIITVDPENQMYSSADGILFDKGRTSLILYPAMKDDTSFSVPDSVSSIKEDAFTGNTSLRTLIIPETVEEIADDAFTGFVFLDRGGTIISDVSLLPGYLYSGDSVKTLVRQYPNVIYDENGGSLQIEPLLISDGDTFVLSEYKGTRTGFSFGGWSYGDRTYQSGDNMTKVSGDMTFTAVWNIGTYSITFDTDGGSAVEKKVQYYGTEVSAPDDPFKDGYSFIKWQLNGEDYVFTTMPAEDITLKAIWNISTFRAMFVSDGVVISNISYEYGAVISAPVYTPEKTSTYQNDYVFLSWSGFTAGMKITSDVTFDAQFKAVVKSVSTSGGYTKVEAKDVSVVDIPKDSVDKVKTSSNQLTVSVSFGSISLDSGAISSLTSSDTTVSITEADRSKISSELLSKIGDHPIYTILIGDVHEFGGKLMISVKYDLKDDESSSNVYIWYLKNDGSYEKISCSYSNGYATFTTDHLSDYAVMADSAQPQSKTGTGIDLALIIGIVVGALVVLVLIFLILKKKRD